MDHNNLVPKRAVKGFLAVWIAAAVIGLGLFGVVTWGFIVFMNWVTAQ